MPDKHFLWFLQSECITINNWNLNFGVWGFLSLSKLIFISDLLSCTTLYNHTNLKSGIKVSDVYYRQIEQ